MKLHHQSAKLFDTDEELEKAKNAAFRLLSGRAYTRAEVEKKLRGRRFSHRAVTETLGTLEQLGLIDDRAFARQWVESRMHGRPMGRIRLARELKQQGVPEALVEEALDESLAEVDIEAVALDLLRSRARRYQGIERQKALSRMFQFLGRRGFSAPVCREAAERAWSELCEDQEGSG